MTGETLHTGLYPQREGPGLENNYFTEICSGFDAGSYVRLIDFVYHSTLGLRVIKKKKTWACDAGR